MRSLTFLTSLSALTVLTAASSANLVQNGGFESPLVTPGGYIQYNAGTTFSGGWLVGGHDVDLVSTTYAESGIVFNANSGLASLDLTGGGNTGANSVSQTFATTVGQSYSLSFFLGRANSTTTGSYTGPASISLDVTITGGTTQTFTNSNLTPGGIQWTQYGTSFVATGTSTTLTFTNSTPGDSNFAGLDDVTVAVPGPAAMAAFGFGLLGRIRRRKA